VTGPGIANRPEHFGWIPAREPGWWVHPRLYGSICIEPGGTWGVYPEPSQQAPTAKHLTAVEAHLFMVRANGASL
jgi:hypothetical protein